MLVVLLESAQCGGFYGDDFILFTPKSNPISALTLKQILDGGKSKLASLAYQNGFGPTFLYGMLRLAKFTTNPSICCSLAI